MALTDVKSEQIQSSVALAGSPTTTTQSASDNSTKIATTAYVETAVANLVASAPAALNTLDELAAALNDDASFSTTVTNSIATKLPLTGGTVSGLLTAAAKLKITDVGNATVAALQLTDAGLGISSPTTDQMNFITADTTRMVIDSSGNVGIGAAPASGYGHLQVRGSFGYINEDGSNTKQMYLRTNYDTGNPAIQVATAHDLLFATSNVTRMTIGSSGNIQVGSTTVFNNSGVLQSAALSGTYSNPVNFSHSSLELSGHMFFNEFSSGRHYIHFKTAASTNQIDWRIQTNSANNTIHSWTNTLASFATPIAVPAGSASAPSLTFSGDTNTGLFRAASDQLGFAAAGAQQALFLNNRYLFGTTVSGVYYDASNVYTPTMLLKSSNSGELATLALINGDNAYGGSIDFAHITSNTSVQQRFAAIVGVSDNRVSSAGSGHLSFRTRATGSTTNITEHMRITAGGTVSIGGVAAPFSKFQVGSHTFSGGNGMYANSRVGISNHGSLTGLMLASTYNDAAHPEYGLVFIQGPSTSSYNAWSISPDGPAKGNRLNFHYGAQAANIHSPGYRKASLDGSGNFYPVGNVVMPSAKGIDFSAVAGVGAVSGSPPGVNTTSSLLDDYEEGTFSAEIQGQTTAGAFNYTLQQGRYTKIGRLVSVVMTIYFASRTQAPAGNIIIKLPFTASSQNTQHSFYVGWAQYITFSGTQLSAYAGGNTLVLRGITSGGSGSVVGGSDIGSAMYLMISGTYYV